MTPAATPPPAVPLGSRVRAATPVARPEVPVEVSVVVPVMDEVDNVAELCARIAGVVVPRGLSWELLFIDDGSSDGTWEAIVALAGDYEEVRAVRQRRNFGKAAALGTGFAHARGDVVITMDGDLQDDPREIPRFLAAIAGGNDVVSGWKRVRHDPLGKRLPSKVFNGVTRRVSGVDLHDFNCGFKAYTRAAAKSLSPRVYGEMHRYLPVLLSASGYRVGEIEVLHHARLHGRSKYGPGRMLAGAMDVLTVTLITRFRERPLHVFGLVALLVLILGTALTVGLAFTDGVNTSLTALLPTLGCSISLLGAGLVCELVVSSQGALPNGDRMADGVRMDPAPPVTLRAVDDLADDIADRVADRMAG